MNCLHRPQYNTWIIYTIRQCLFPITIIICIVEEGWPRDCSKFVAEKKATKEQYLFSFSFIYWHESIFDMELDTFHSLLCFVIFPASWPDAVWSGRLNSVGTVEVTVPAMSGHSKMVRKHKSGNIFAHGGDYVAFCHSSPGYLLLMGFMN